MLNKILQQSLFKQGLFGYLRSPAGVSVTQKVLDSHIFTNGLMILGNVGVGARMAAKSSLASQAETEQHITPR